MFSTRYSSSGPFSLIITYLFNSKLKHYTIGLTFFYLVNSYIYYFLSVLVYP